MRNKFEIVLPLKYRPIVKKLAGDLHISMRKLIEMILIIYIKELNEEYFDEIKDELIRPS